MPTDQPADSLLAQFFDALPYAAIYLKAVRDEQQHLIDLLLVEGNQKGRLLVGQGIFHADIGERILRGDPDRERLLQPIFQQYATLLRTGITQEFDYLNPVLHRVVHVSRSQMGDGVLVVVRDPVEHPDHNSANEELTNLLRGILEASLNGIITYESIRNNAGIITDFRFVRLNQAAMQMLALTAEVVGKPMVDELPGVKESGLFAQFVEVVETGQSSRFEIPFPVGNDLLYYDMSVVRLGDGFVVTFNNVTESKLATLAIERQAAENRRQANLLEGILYASHDAIWVFESIRDDKGVIVDFRYTHANPMTTQMYGYALDDLLNSTFLTLYPSARENGLFNRYRAVVETGEPYHEEVFYDSDGLNGWYDIAGVKLGDGAVLTVKDVTSRKRAAVQLEQQAEELRTTFDSSLSGIFTMTAIRDEHGTITDFRFRNANRAVKQNLNKEPEEMIGHTLLELFPGNIETGFFDVYARVTNTGQPERYLQYYTDTNNFTGWFDVSVVKQEPDGVINTFLNVTERVEASLKSERQADLLNSVLNSSVNGIMAFESVRDAGGQIVDFSFRSANEASCRMIGRTADELIGQRLLSVFPGNVESGLFAMYVKTTQTGEPSRTEVYYNHDGLDFWLDVSSQKLGDGFVVTFTDVSVVKQATQAVKQAAAELQTVIDTSQTGIFLFTAVRDEAGEVVDFRFRVANRQLASYVGQLPEAVVGALGSTWFPGYKTNGLFENYKHTYLTGEQRRFDFHYNSDGIDVWLDIMSSKMGDEVLVTFGDYTPLKKLQQQLQESVIDLQRSNRNLEQFAYVASHDLQEPLRKIQAFADILQTQYSPVLGDQGVDMLGRMQSAARRMQILIKDVLAYSRIATKRDAIGPVDLSELVNDVLSDLETAIADKRAVIGLGALPTVTGDSLQLRQLFQNLISNSLKFTSPGRIPEVSLTSRTLRGRDACIPVSEGDENRLFHQINLQDNGIGFDPHQAPRIFQVFQRLHGRNEYQGTGIGLAIVQKVVENHQGYISAEGRPGEGATFTLLLPA